MKFKTPRDCAAVSHGGVILAIDGNGSIEAPEDAASQLAAHGIFPREQQEEPVYPAALSFTPAVIRRMSRPGLIAALETLGDFGTTAKTLAELRKTLGDAIEAQAPP